MLAVMVLVMSLIMAVPVWAAETEVDDTNTAVKFEGSWIVHPVKTNLEDARNKTMMVTATKGDYAELTFKGTYLQFYGRTAPGGGIFDIYIDGVKKETIDSYAAEGTSGVLLYEIKDLAPGEHTFKVLTNGEKNEKAGFSNMFFDAVVYGGETGAAAAAPAAPAVSNPKTGDSGIMLPVLLMAGSLGIILFLARRKSVK